MDVKKWLLILECLTFHIVSIIASFMQLNSALLLCIMHQRRINGTILKLLLARKRGFSRRMKLAKKRRITQKRRLWYKPGRTDLWWQNLISGVAPKEFWKKNFRLTDTMFLNLLKIFTPTYCQIQIHQIQELSLQKRR